MKKSLKRLLISNLSFKKVKEVGNPHLPTLVKKRLNLILKAFGDYMTGQILNDANEKHVKMGIAYFDLRQKVKKRFSYFGKVTDRIEDKLESLTRVTKTIYGSVIEGYPYIKASHKSLNTIINP